MNSALNQSVSGEGPPGLSSVPTQVPREKWAQGIKTG